MSAGEVGIWQFSQSWSGCVNGTGAVRPEQVRHRAWIGQRMEARKCASPVRTGTGLWAASRERSGANSGRQTQH